jgi:hypothetical protein
MTIIQLYFRYQHSKFPSNTTVLATRYVRIGHSAVSLTNCMSRVRFTFVFTTFMQLPDEDP